MRGGVDLWGLVMGIGRFEPRDRRRRWTGSGERRAGLESEWIRGWSGAAGCSGEVPAHGLGPGRGTLGRLGIESEGAEDLVDDIGPLDDREDTLLPAAAVASSEEEAVGAEE